MSVRALTRGLDILRYINKVGVCKAAGIAADLDIPRPTVYRLLETLEQQGYVAFSPTSTNVRVTRLAGSLGDGYAASTELCQIAGPLFAEYSDKIIWPLDLAVYENAKMVVQETTHNRNPLSIDRGMTGYRLPMLRSSAGRCYLGFCPPGELKVIVRQLKREAAPEDSSFLHNHYLNQMLAEVRQNGFGARFDLEYGPKTSSLSVPLISAGRVVCCVSVIWSRAAMTQEEAVGKLLTPMQELSGKMNKVIDS